MKQLKYKLEFKKNGVYLAYQRENMGKKFPIRKTLTIFRYLSGKLYKCPLRGEILSICGSNSKENWIDWGIRENEIITREYYLWPEDRDTIIPWSDCEIFELNEDEILNHVVVNEI